MLTIKEIVENTFAKWSDEIRSQVGDNYSMENSAIVSQLPYASMYFMGLPGAGYDLNGQEAGVNPTIQIDIYTQGQMATSNAYEIDEASHAAMQSMGYQRSFGPEFTQNIDPSIKRLSSRYQRVIGYGDNL